MTNPRAVVMMMYFRVLEMAAWVMRLMMSLSRSSISSLSRSNESETISLLLYPYI